MSKLPIIPPVTATFGSDLKRKIEVSIGPDGDELDGGDKLCIMPLGAGNEVGRSCIILSFKGKTVMLDAGIHPAHEGIAGLPFYDNIDPTTIDLVLITQCYLDGHVGLNIFWIQVKELISSAYLPTTILTTKGALTLPNHFHLDHAASLPYFMEKTSYDNPVYMTHPTKAIYKWFLTDYVRVSTASVDDMLFDEQDLLRSYEKISVVDYHQQVDIDGIKFTSYNAGHVLGAAMFLIEIAGVRVLYTGDYSREEDRHLMAAERPAHIVPDVLICEATFGNLTHEPRLEREARFTGRVHDIVMRGGRCLIPVFALGRAQELLLILDEFWQAHPELDTIPIYFASSLAKKCMAVYQTYINMMNSHIRSQFSHTNPFIFKHISNLRHVSSFDDSGPCVMVASPGMLQNGLSRELFERWCTNPRNGLLLCGYSVEGTLARTILSSPETVPSMRGGRLPLRMSVDYISFSAHVDFAQNSEFIELVAAPNLVLVHGEPIPMMRLKQALSLRYVNPLDPATIQPKDLDPTVPSRRRMAIYTPKNTETVTLKFQANKVARVVGKLASKEPLVGDEVEGVLVGRDFQYRLMDPMELDDLAGLNVDQFHQQLNVPFHAKFSLITTTLIRMFGKSNIQPLSSPGHSIMVADTVEVMDHTEELEVQLKWATNPNTDMVADSILACIVGLSCSPASVKLTYTEHDHSHDSQPADSALAPEPIHKLSKSDKLALLLGDMFDSARVIELDNGEEGVRVDFHNEHLLIKVEGLSLVTPNNPKFDVDDLVEDEVNHDHVKVTEIEAVEHDVKSTKEEIQQNNEIKEEQFIQTELDGSIKEEANLIEQELEPVNYGVNPKFLTKVTTILNRLTHIHH